MKPEVNRRARKERAREVASTPERAAEGVPESEVLRAAPRMSEPPLDGPEIYGRAAINNIARALPPFERAYAYARFSILRAKLLSVMDLLLPDEGRILDVGCGFGLFAAYFGQMHPRREILGIDPDARRVKMAEKVTEAIGLRNKFVAADARDARIQGPFDAAYVLDVMHHIPAADQLPMLARLRDLLAPRGLLILKDVTTEPAYGLKFTELLDRLMVGWNEPLNYRHHHEWGAMLRSLGFKVRMVRVPDVLPYPHVVISAQKI